MNGMNTEKIKVICDKTNNPPETIARGMFYVDYWVPLKPAESILESIDCLKEMIWQSTAIPMPVLYPPMIIKYLDVVKERRVEDGW